MPAVSNKTQKPLSVPLPGGRKLHLGPGKTAPIAANAVNGPGLKKLIDAGEVEIVSGDPRPTAGSGGGTRSRTAMFGHASGRGRRGGDR